MAAKTKRRSAEEWKRIISEWQRSGLSKREFARQADIHPGTLGWWQWRLRSEPALPEFLEVVVEDETRGRAPEFDLTVGNFGVRVPIGFDAHELRRLLAVLC